MSAAVQRFRYAAAAACLALGAWAGPAQAQLVVTEFLPDPTGTDVDREWFEIYNNSPSVVSIAGYAAGDGTDPLNTSTGEGMGVFPAGAVINPFQVIIVAANANGFNGLYSRLPDYEFANSTSTLGNNSGVPDLTQKPGWGAASGASLGIANGGDDVGILTPDSTPTAFTFLDGGNHGSVTTFYTGAATLGSNQAYERVPADVDTNSVSEWVVRTTGQATPGVVTVPEPAGLCVAALAGLGLLLRRRRAGR